MLQMIDVSLKPKKHRKLLILGSGPTKEQLILPLENLVWTVAGVIMGSKLMVEAVRL
jgi:hypothetical protein